MTGLCVTDRVGGSHASLRVRVEALVLEHYVLTGDRDLHHRIRVRGVLPVEHPNDLRARVEHVRLATALLVALVQLVWRVGLTVGVRLRFAATKHWREQQALVVNVVVD